MRERTIPPVFINFEIPDQGCKQDNRAFHKEVPLFLNPTLVQVKHNYIRGLVSIRNVGQECRVERVAPVAVARIIEIDDIEPDRTGVFIPVLKQLVISDQA